MTFTNHLAGRVRKRVLPGLPRGVALIEFAFVAPVLIALLLLITEFGIALYDQSVITNAAREGARAGVVKRKDPEDSVLEKVRGVVMNYTDGRLISFDPSPSDEPVNVSVFSEVISGTEPALRVQVNYEYRGLLLLGSRDQPLVLSSEAVMRYE
jgi:hypothetical protein